MLNFVNTSYIVKRQHQLVGELGEIPPSIEIKCRSLKYWASMLTNPDKLSSRVYNVLLMLYNKITMAKICRKHFKCEWAWLLLVDTRFR